MKYKFLHTETDVYGHHNFDPNGKEAANQSVMGLSMLVKVEINRVTKHVIFFDTFSKSIARISHSFMYYIVYSK